MGDIAIEASGLVKRYGSETALDGLDLAVPAGTVFGLLGPNGAGKTTAVRILTTLLKPDGGTGRVAGHDIVREPALVRRSIGLSGQYAAVDENLTGRENLVMFGRLYRLRAAAARARAAELLERFRLTEAADRVVKGYSGGMRRRLDLAAGLIVRPKVIFMDEPTTGLDPRARADVWDAVRDLVAEGATLLLTTQYLEEADTLADDILIIDRGRAVAQGSPDELKSRVGDEHLELQLSTPEELARAEAILRDAVQVTGRVEERELDRALIAPVGDGVAALAEVSTALATAGVRARGMSLRRPTLDEVFLALTERDPEPAVNTGSKEATS